NRHKKGQPVLVGTVAIETSELISKIISGVRASSTKIESTSSIIAK
ncbi:preprotein translocase subunit SecA, partial [Bacillus sp. SS-TM]